jgi:exopolysaccharide biosynthesis polyprenyl glycosylphosphotransferase
MHYSETKTPFRVALPFSERRFLLLCVDVLLINLSVFGGFYFWAWVGPHEFSFAFVVEHWFWFPILTVAWGGLAWFWDLYEVEQAARRLDVLGRVGLVVLNLAIGYLVVYFLLPRDSLPRLFFLFFLILASAGLAIWRWTYATVFTLPFFRRRVIIVGAGWAGETVAQILTNEGSEGYTVVGFVDDDPEKHDKQIVGRPVLGSSEDLMDLVTEQRVDKVLLAVTHHMRGALFQALMDCRAAGIHVMRMPDLYERLTQRVPVEHVNQEWVLEATDGFTAVGRVEQAFRRLLELVFGVLGLLVLGVLLPFVALAIKLDDRGTVFYRQVRAGRASKLFDVLKFRTMCSDAEVDGKPKWATEDDPRITSVGKFLRRTRLDELPQVINVLRGEMHLVGPRPERPEFITDLEKQIPFYRTRLVVKPGLTGWAQINYGYGNSVEDSLVKLQYDLYYIRHRSIWLDLYVVFKTIGVVLRGSGT